jgi:copper transport protein
VRRTLGRWLLVALLCALPATAGAHAVLVESTPAPDSTVVAPGALTLDFNEPVRPVFVRVLDRTGRDVAEGVRPEARDTQVTLALPRLSNGVYIVSWSVVSTDSHPIGGSFRFAVGAAPAWDAAPRDDGFAARASLWDWIWIAARAAFLFALLGAVGGIWFLHLDDPPEARRSLRRWIDTAVLFGLLLIPLQGAVMRVAAPGDLLEAALWRAGFDTPLGTSVAIAVVALSTCAIVLKRVRGRLALTLLSLVALIGPVSLAFTGHVASVEPRAVTTVAIGLHGATAAFWLGALWRLLGAARHMPDATLAALLRRFSRVAVLAVAALALAGLVLALVQVETVPALVTTRYGQLLLVKLGIVIGVLLIAWDNRRRLTPALATGHAGAHRRLTRNLRLEIAGIAAIVLVTALLGRTTPPRAVAAQQPAQAQPHHALSATDRLGRRAEIVVSRRAGGGHVVTVQIRGPDGAHLAPRDAELAAALPARGIEPIRRPMALVDHGARYEGTDLALPGRWILRIDALITDFDKASFEVEVEIGPP